MVSDGISLDILMRDLSSALRGSEIQYDDGFLTMVPDRVTEEEAYSFFDAVLDDLDSVPSPVPMPLSDSTGERTLVLEDVDDACRRYGVSAGSFLTAAFAYALSRFTGGDR